MQAGTDRHSRSNGRDHSVRTDKGNDISKEKPSFVVGAGGGGGFVRSLDSGDNPAAVDLVFLPTGSFEMAGACQARRV
jgi:hypothetical protein